MFTETHGKFGLWSTYNEKACKMHTCEVTANWNEFIFLKIQLNLFRDLIRVKETKISHLLLQFCSPFSCKHFSFFQMQAYIGKEPKLWVSLPKFFFFFSDL